MQFVSRGASVSRFHASGMLSNNFKVEGFAYPLSPLTLARRPGKLVIEQPPETLKP